MEGIIARCAAAHLALALGGRAAGLGEHPALALLSDGLMAGWIDLAWIEPPERPETSSDTPRRPRSPPPPPRASASPSRPEVPGLGLELAW